MSYGSTLLRFVFPVSVFLLSIIISSNLRAAENEDLNLNEISPRMQSIIATHILRIEAWTLSPLLIEAVRAQNLKNTSLKEIKRINNDWINGKDEKLVTALLNNPVSSFLNEKVYKNNILYAEAFLCDSKGAVVGAYPKTSDYWQGDEDKFIHSYNNGDGRVYIGELKFDESTHALSVQVSVPVLDNGKTIGVLVVGLHNVIN